MRLANFADLHACGKDLPAFSRQWDAGIDRAIAERVDAVTIAGDVFDSAEIGDQYASDGAVLEAVQRPLVRLAEAGIPAYIVSGDHDQAGAGRASAILGLAGIPGVTCTVEPTLMSISKHGEHVNLYMLPWDWTPGVSAEAEIETLLGLANPLLKATRILIGHVSTSGLLMNRHRAAERIEAPSSRARNWQVSREYLDELIASGRVHHIRLGDFHLRHEHYIGALRQRNHGEEGNPQGFEILDTSTGEKTWIELDEAPRYRTVEVGVGEMAPDAPGENEILKVRLNCEMVPGGIRQLENAGIQVERIVEREERRTRADVPAGIVHDDDAMIRMYAKTRNPPVEGAELERHLRVFHEVTGDAHVATNEAPEPVLQSAATGTDDLPF